ncbi:MAG: hypothetical protein AB2A00_23150 [Myxococcota bacterium]
MGVDQTGAVMRGGAAARPLKAAVALEEGRGAWRLHVDALEGLTSVALNALLERAKAPGGGVALLVDCVLGLPRGVWSGTGADALWAVMRRCADDDGGRPRYGMARAERFFASLLPEHARGTLPRRECELVARCTSVFQTRPFQKNIQTGTYRIWRDLTEDRARWVNIWPFDDETTAIPRAPWVFESFPSLLWRTLLGLPTRDRTRLRNAVKDAYAARGMTLRTHQWLRILDDADASDAAVLAVGGPMMQREGRLWTPFEAFDDVENLRSEGWILGLNR